MEALTPVMMVDMVSTVVIPESHNTTQHARLCQICKRFTPMLYRSVQYRENSGNKFTAHSCFSPGADGLLNMLLLSSTLLSSENHRHMEANSLRKISDPLQGTRLKVCPISC